MEPRNPDYAELKSFGPKPVITNRMQRSRKVSWTHFEEPPFKSCMALAIASVEGSDERRWTWSAVPPISMAFIAFSRAMPPKYGQSRSWSTGGISGRRSLVLKTQ